ncbi:hypothetical protein BGX27_009843, partial [Mortierella sp. AM989]
FQPTPWQQKDQDSRQFGHHPKPEQFETTIRSVEPPEKEPSSRSLISDHVKEEQKEITLGGTSTRPIKMLRSKASSSSISSTTSSSSNTTAQTFMSTFSFNTITGGHTRSITQEELLSSSVESDSWASATPFSEDKSEWDGEVDVKSLDVAILTPTENIHFDPFEQRDIQHQHGQNRSSQYQSFERSRGHIKTFSQQSNSTIRGGHPSGMLSIVTTAPLSPSPTSSSSATFRQRAQRVDEDAAEDAAEDMMFASPDYRKSVALSDHSDLALDPSSPYGRDSSANISEMAQYTNLLRDATMIIEQQHLQGHITSEPIGDYDSSDVDLDDSNGHQDGYPRYDAESSGGFDRSKSSQSSSRGPEADSNAERPPVSSNRGALTRSRSRRFSAPGHSGPSHTSLDSLSKASEALLPRTESTTTQNTVAFISPSAGSRLPPTLNDNDNQPGRLGDGAYLPISNSNSDNVAEGSSFKRAFHPLQHHATMQPYLGSETESTTIGPSFATTSASQYQPRLRHDYRPGVVFEYYEGEWDWLPNFDEMRPDNAGIVGNFMIDDTTEQDLFRIKFSHQSRRQFKEPGNFAVRFTTHINITQDGVYSFWLSSNDGSILYVSDTLVVENDGMHYATEVEGRILLQPGRHPMTVEFFHKNGKMLEGFRSTGPSLIVSYMPPGPTWSFGLKPRPKRIINSNNLFYDHGDVRLKDLLREFGVDVGSSSSMENNEHLSSNISRNNSLGVDFWPPNTGNSNLQNSQPSRCRNKSRDMSHLQPSARELNVQMENAKTTIRDLEQIIRDQGESHKKKMAELYSILQDTESQVDRMVTGLKKATLFDAPRTTITPNYHIGNSHPSTWRNTVASVYVDAEEDHPQESEQEQTIHGDSGSENAADSDDILAKHIADVEKLKQLYFFSMALSVKMNGEMMEKKTPEYTSTSVQKLYEDCAINSKVPVEGWPGCMSHLSCTINPVRFFTRSLITVSPTPSGSAVKHTKRRLFIKDFYVTPDESGMRLDRFLKHRLDKVAEFPPVNNSLISKWLRKKQIKLIVQNDHQTDIARVEGLFPGDTKEHQSNLQGVVLAEASASKKAKTEISRTEAGQTWRIRVLTEVMDDTYLDPPRVRDNSIENHNENALPLQDWVVYMDEKIVVLDKPAGIVVQGGTGVERSIDDSLAGI